MNENKFLKVMLKAIENIYLFLFLGLFIAPIAAISAVSPRVNWYDGFKEAAIAVLIILFLQGFLFALSYFLRNKVISHE